MEEAERVQVGIIVSSPQIEIMSDRVNERKNE
jgi:hypothetical protein